jgi:hypothetical protein
MVVELPAIDIQARRRQRVVARLRPLLSADARAVLVCLALAALTLLLPSAPTYDPWAWLVWGREVAHLDLVTSFGPSWKPLPVIFTTLFSPFGDVAPDLWLIVARAGGLLAVLLAYRLGARLGGRLGGVAATVFLVLSMGWVRNAWLGNSEGLLVALALWAVERHLDGRRGQALLLGVGAALLRPETWPLLGLYGLWLFVQEPRRRPQLVAAAAAVAALWLLPELWGSGDPFRASERANTPNPDSPAFAGRPALAVLERAFHVLPLPAVIAFVAAAALAGTGLWRRRRAGEALHGPDAATLGLSLGGVGLLAIVAVMTEAGYSGNLRYLVLPAALGAVVAGIGFARLARSARGAGAGQIAATALLAAACLPSLLPRLADVLDGRHALAYQADLYDDLGVAVERAGGGERILACGDPYTGPFQVPALAWQLEVHTKRVGLSPAAPAAVFRAPPTQPEPPTPDLGALAGKARPAARAGRWTVLAACRGGRPLAGVR